MASLSSLLSEEQIQCSICLDVFTEPVTTPCGHNFCKACISGYWNKTGLCQCPMCKDMFYRRPELKMNTTLGDVADHFKRMRDRDESPAEPGEVACDVCTGRKHKALKSCLECLTAFCETHLQPHNRVAGLKRHTLINPVENLQDRMCKKHDRLLELFCRTDQTCVCKFCTETDHKTHLTVPLEEECGQRKAKLGKTEAEVQQMIQERLQKVQEIKHSVKFSKRAAEREIADSMEVFTALVRCVERSQAEFIEVVEEKLKAAEWQAEFLIEELEQEITKLQRRCSDLEQLLHTKDHLHLLQSSPPLCKLPPTRNWSQKSVHSQLCLRNVRRVVYQLEDTLHNEMEKLPDIKLKRMQQCAVDVTLDPDTAHPFLILGKKKRKQVRCGEENQGNPTNYPKRFKNSFSVLGKEGFSSGRFYYEVQVTGKTWWWLGVASESIDRKESLNLSSDGLWTVWLNGENGYGANNYYPVRLSLREKPQKVGVFVDYEKGQVSFYDVKAKSHIYSFDGCNFTEKLYPYFNPYLSCSGENSAPLVISSVNHTQ
ncbi:E3 ubiquitin-protein ligase TRIM21-like [Salvelinus fontinalis]|uniref:E3 ubiquitin-protein ligase TRIM21-like n=1 Tax=Salvelinus fontinalis TaxID=8038 RepID=UPI0024865298|nr:E3 ubiquitin-protein ligase TRIM21-like [Salvelinus fontinalis]